MKKIILTLVALTSFSQFALADTYVNGYTRSNGTYVQPYTRSDSNYTQFDNYSTRGNINPYTGNSGTINVNTPSHNYGYNQDYSNNSNNLNNQPRWTGQTY
jgi:hypothetical protein